MHAYIHTYIHNTHIYVNLPLGAVARLGYFVLNKLVADANSRVPYICSQTSCMYVCMYVRTYAQQACHMAQDSHHLRGRVPKCVPKRTTVRQVATKGLWGFKQSCAPIYSLREDTKRPGLLTQRANKHSVTC